MAMNPYNFAITCRALMEGASVQDIVKFTGLHTISARRFIRQAYLDGLLYVYDWASDAKGNPSIRIFRFKQSDADTDAVRPVSDETRARYPVGHPSHLAMNG
jgi:hypothetical protein